MGFPPGAGADAAAWRRRTAANFLMTNPGRAEMSEMSGFDPSLLPDGFTSTREGPAQGRKAPLPATGDVCAVARRCRTETPDFWRPRL